MAGGERVYFVGAGASKQDRFPLTNELKHGIAWAILQDSARFDLLAAHLRYLCSVQREALEASAAIWDAAARAPLTSRDVRLLNGKAVESAPSRCSKLRPARAGSSTDSR